MSTRSFRPRRSQADSRAHILSAAQDLLAEKGADRLKLTEVAAAAGVSHPTVLHHFGSIGELQAELMEQMIRDLVAKIMVCEAPGNPEEDQMIGLNSLFDTFATPGAARLAAWLEITGEHRKMVVVRETIKAIVAERMVPAGWESAPAEELVLLATTLALGVGLFGNSLAEHLGHAAGSAKTLALNLLIQEMERRRPHSRPAAS